MKAFLVSALFATSVIAAPPPTPVWPSSFAVAFNETTSIIIASSNTSGVWYYDAANNRGRMDRATGQYDRYCGSIKSDDSPCQHLVVNDKRYLVWPALQYCCMCCTSSQGCGLTRPDWMVADNATYVGQQPVTTPNFKGSADVWQADGLQPNFYYQTITGNPAPVELAQVPNDYQYFDPTTFKPGPQSDALFEVPSYCSPSCPVLSTCSVASHHGQVY